MALWQKNTAKTWHFGKITAFTEFDKNCGFRDFRVSVIIYCPYISITLSQTLTVIISITHSRPVIGIQ